MLWIAKNNMIKLNKTKVVHCKKSKYDISCGRPSKWGNCFEIGKDGDRDEVIQKYEDWIICGEGQRLLKLLNELKGRILGCWCKPKKCHCDILANLAENFDPPKDNSYYNYYLEGFIACYERKSEDDNPYTPSGHERDTTFQDEQHYHWYSGYWDCADYLDHRKGKYE